MRSHLEGCAVLLLEDDFIIAMALESRLQSAGAVVQGPFADIDDAERAIEEGPRPDVALLDVNVRGRSSVELAAELHAAGVSLIFVTGYSSIPELPAELGDAIVLRKPISDRTLADAVRAACECPSDGGGGAPPSRP